jgi:small subunit ribosomal protein S4
MLALLERRLDNTLYRSGFAASRAEARQIVRHGHVKINGKRVDIPSYEVRVGEKLELTPKAQKFKIVAASVASAEKRNPASWLDVDKANFTISVKGAPPREDLNEPEIREQLVVEYYSR